MEQKSLLRIIVGLACIFIAIILIAFVGYKNSKYSTYSRTFSSNTLLTSSWEKYKNKFINADGRVVDTKQGNITTSEGQSYALLRAVWVDDKQTFDKVWNWTKTNLRTKNNNLFGWKWGKKTDSSYGLFSEGGENSATDADSDIALALLLAGKRWNNETYTNEAKKIIPDIWTVETAEAAGQRYLIAGNWAKQKDKLIINPSYFAPYAWRMFMQIDSTHNWDSMIDPAYKLLTDSSSLPLNTQKSAGLPPNWIQIDTTTGEIKPTTISNATTDYSYDAIRVPWRIALDYKWNTEKKAYTYLSTLSFLSHSYSENGKLAASYNHAGTILEKYENPTMYATSIAYFIVVDPKKAKQMYEDKITKLYSNDTNTFNENIPYYEQNWLWFGAAMYSNYLSHF